MNRERRLKIFPVRTRDILRGFYGRAEDGIASLVCTPTAAFPGLPESYKIITVHYHLTRDCFDFILEHPSFDPVEDGDEIPRHDSLLSVDWYLLSPAKNDAGETLTMPDGRTLYCWGTTDN